MDAEDDANEEDEDGANDRDNELLPNVISGSGRLSDCSALSTTSQVLGCVALPRLRTKQ